MHAKGDNAIMTVHRSLVALICLLMVGTVAIAQDAETVRARLDRLPQPWKARMHRVTQQEYEATLHFWAEKHPDICTLEKVGGSTGGSPIYLVKITDKGAADQDKQVALVSCLHAGPERSGTTTALHLIEWLLGESPEARRTRQKQIVLLMPIVQPEAFFETDRFFNANGIDPYTGRPGAWDLNKMAYPDLEKAPELAAFLAVVDRYQPEVNVDLHGTGLQEYPPERLGDRTMYQGQTMFEITGSAYSNNSLRPWDWRVTEAMVAAGVEAGYGSERFEADAQQMFWGPAMQPIADRVWLGRPNFYTAQYAYAKYHTMVSTLEIGWEESGVARVRGLLKIGNETWPGEPATGYPVDRVTSFLGHFLTALGGNAAERRTSRVELWQQQGRFAQAMLYPQTDGRDSYVLALTDEGGKRLDADKGRFLANLEGLPGVDPAAIRAFVDAGPEDKLYVQRRTPAKWVQPHAVEHGLGIRLRLPYRRPQIADLRVNGHEIPQGTTDGYQSWYADGYTQVQINLPPAKVREMELVVVTCAYAPDVERKIGWEPPQEVRDQLNAATPQPHSDHPR